MAQRRSLVTLVLLCALLLALRATQTAKHALTWDVFGYYLYLPATFIHDDVALRDHAWLDEVMVKYDPSSTLYQLVDGPDGTRVIKYSSGMALAYAPWFFVAHVLAEPLGYVPDGFSAPYQYLITYGMLVWVLAGLFLFRKVLLHFFSDGWTAVLLALTVLGTNYLHLASLDGTLLTHPFLFTLYAGLVLATLRWHERPTWMSAAAIGACAGWITLVRPSEGVCVLLPLLWMNSDDFAAKWRMVATQWRQVGLLLAAFLLFTSPQLLYWKSVTGQWLFYSYINPGEGFDFASPHLVDYLFSFRKGWFVYTPLMLLAVVGLHALRQRARHVFWPIVVFLVLDVYVVASWTNWWYAGGSFSARSMVPTYVLLALPLGYLLQNEWRKFLLPAAGAFLLLNLFQTWQWNQGILPKERMTGAYYVAVFGRTNVPDGAAALMLVDRPLAEVEELSDESRYAPHTLFAGSFDDRPDSCYTLTAEDPYTPGPDVTFAELTGKDHAWLRVSARLFVTDSTQAPPVIVCTFHHQGQTYKYKTATWDLTSAPKNNWNICTFDYITPEVRSLEDNLKVYIWNQHGGVHWVDDLRVEVFEAK